MAQPAQVFRAGGSREYVVVDNGVPAVSITANGNPQTSNNWAGTNPDGSCKGFDDEIAGAIGQGKNIFGTGTIPDGAAIRQPAPGVGTIAQKAAQASTGSVASLAKAFTSNNALGNTLVVVCGVGNGTAPTVSDTQGNTYTQVAQIANGVAFNVAIFVAPNSKVGANTVTVNNGGAAASIAMEIYEVQGLLAVASADAANTNQSGANATSPLVSVTPSQANEYAFVAFGLGTAAQTITVGGSYVNDSGQLNPTTPAGLFSFVSASLSPVGATSTPSASVGTPEPWAVAAVVLKSATPGLTLATGKISAGVFFKNPA